MDVGGNSWSVGLSTEYGRTNDWSGSFNLLVRCSPEENRVAKGEAVTGKGFLLTGDDEVDDMDDIVSVRGRRDNDGIRSRGFWFSSSSGV